MTPERAKEIIKAQAQFPYWGNYTRFMSHAEEAHVRALWLQSPGNWSLASVVLMIAKGEG